MIAFRINVERGFAYGLAVHNGRHGRVVSISPNGTAYSVGSYGLRPGHDFEIGSRRKADSDDGFYAAIGLFVGYGNTARAALDAVVRVLQAASADPVEPLSVFDFFTTADGSVCGVLMIDKFRFRCGCVRPLTLEMPRDGQAGIQVRLAEIAAAREHAACDECAKRFALGMAHQYDELVAEGVIDEIAFVLAESSDGLGRSSNTTPAALTAGEEVRV